MMHCGVGLECARATGETFEESLNSAVEAGYSWVEPFVFTPIHLALNSHVTIESNSAYHHLNTATSDLGEIRRLMDQSKLHFSAFDAHGSLLLPEIGVMALGAAIDLAAEVGCPIVMSDEGPVSEDWMPLDRAFDLMCFTLEVVIKHAASRGVRFALELHNALTVSPQYLARMLGRFGPDDLGLNLDTGNFFLAGHDPVRFLREFAGRVIHVHIKDIPASQLHQRGKVTGTRVGTAAGRGVVDLKGVVNVLAEAKYCGALSVECDTWDDARISRVYLEDLLPSCPNLLISHR